VGGAGGEAVGPVAGGGAGRGAAIGEVKSSGPSPVYKNFADRCLREKGYEVIGWQ
jgi:outer membrane lipoprotein SlyB